MNKKEMIHHKPHSIVTSFRELIFGLEDGIVSSAGAVVGIAAGTGNSKIVILSGVVIVIVEALSMAAGAHLSAKSQRQLLERRIREEEWEIENEPEQETEELRDMYSSRGFDEAEVEILVRRITSDKKLWLEEMIAKELGIGGEQLKESKSAAFVMWISYTVGGAVPVIPFFFLPLQTAIITTFVISLIALFLIGVWKSRVTGTDPLRSGFEMMAVSASAGILGYIIGRLVGSWTGVMV